jgi:hypothetical protein
MTVMSQNSKFEMEVAGLGDLPREELVARWVKTHGFLPPKGLKRGLLERSAAWHLQAKTLGGLSPETRKMLRGATRQLEAGLKQKVRQETLVSGLIVAANSAAIPPTEAAKNSARPLDRDKAGLLAAEARDAKHTWLPGQRGPLAPGTRLLREWNGRQHFVEVVDGGYVFDGKPYRSLSAIARRITGAHWSGPRFFGL